MLKRESKVEKYKAIQNKNQSSACQDTFSHVCKTQSFLAFSKNYFQPQKSWKNKLISKV
jgi:hypothetical protein